MLHVIRDDEDLVLLLCEGLLFSFQNFCVQSDLLSRDNGVVAEDPHHLYLFVVLLAKLAKFISYTNEKS